MSSATDKLDVIWRDIFFGRMVISREWWARWDETFMKVFSGAEAVIALESGRDFDPALIPSLVKKVDELSKILKAVGVCDNSCAMREDGGLELSGTAQALMNDCIGNELHKIMFLVDDPGGPVGSVDRVRRVMGDIREFVNEFKELTLGSGSEA